MILECPHLPSWTLTGLFFFFLYAEIHFRFPRIPSLYFRKQPEIIADVPHRIGPDRALPVLLLVKDADKFPITLLQVTVDIQCGSQKTNLLTEEMDTQVADEYHEWLWFIKIPKEFSGSEVMIDVSVQCEIDGKTIHVNNDNYPQLSHAPFRVFVDYHPLPCRDHWYYGDLHCHSNYTSDQVEFGASVVTTAEMARSMGLDFMAVTDHSYDLDDLPDDYLHNDPLVGKWGRLWRSVEQVNTRHADFTVIPGEELSAGNALDQNVHYLILNNRVFYEGFGDSFEQGFKSRPQWRIDRVTGLLQPGALALAAHPENKPPLSQKLLINRGKWTDADYRVDGLHGVQMWNGNTKHFRKHGLAKWRELLLSGSRLTLVAGNDAHGNFNRFRQLTIPFIHMAEHNQEVFAQAKTVVHISDGRPGIESIIDAVRNGRVVVTDGPFAEFTLENGGRSAGIGDTIAGTDADIDIWAESTPHFGVIDQVVLYIGNLRTRRESRRVMTGYSHKDYSVHIRETLTDLPESGYIRLKVISKTKSRAAYCYTNPVYVEN